MSETKNECGFQQLQDTISQLHEGYKELRSQNEMLRKELDEKTEVERNRKLITMQAGIIRSLKREVKKHKLIIETTKNSPDKKLAEENAKLKEENELLKDILLCRCETNIKYNNKYSNIKN
jgi:hypothetical protein